MVDQVPLLVAAGNGHTDIVSDFLSFVGARGESGNEASFLVGSYINEEKSYLLPT